VTVSDDGTTQSCHYESSLRPKDAKSCTVQDSGAGSARSTGMSSTKDQVTRITFERRFSPVVKPEMAALQPGETLLSGQTMALAIDGQGAVKNCQVVAISGSVKPEYGCTEAAAERFEASAGNAASAAKSGASGARAERREGYLTILVYGHSEHVV
jgi:hypothetical protein